MIKIYSRYNVPKVAGLTCTDKTRTQQHFKNEVDINQIIKRAISTGNSAVFSPTKRAEYYDCSAFDDYRSALDRIADVEEDFYSLPSSVRKEFNNDPDNYVQFMSNPNVDKAVQLGLLEGVEKPAASPSISATSNPSGDPKPTVSEPPAATQ